MTAPRVVFDGGGEGEVSVVAEGRITILGDRAFAPGAPAAFLVSLPDGDIRIAARTLGSKRAPDGRFAVSLRFVNLTRENRERLARVVAP